MEVPVALTCVGSRRPATSRLLTIGAKVTSACVQTMGIACVEACEMRAPKIW